MQEKLLFVRMDRIGDTLVTTPGLRALRMLFPHASIDFLARTTNKIALERNCYIDTLYEYPSDIWGIVKLLYILRTKAYDAVIVANAMSKSTSYIASFLKPKEIWGMPNGKTRRWYTHIAQYQLPTCLRNDAYAIQSGDTIVLHSVLEPLALVEGFAQSRGSTLSNICTPEYTQEDMIHMDFFLDSNSSSMHMQYPKTDKKRIAFFIGNAKKKHTRWPLDKFIALSKRILENHPSTEVFIFMGAMEKAMLDEHNETFPRECILFCASLSDSGALLQTVDCFVTSSTSHMHLAGALDIPTISLLAQYTYHVWRPFGAMQEYIVADEEGVDIHTIEVEEVYKAICKRCNIV